jgi:hypothetical protein
MALYAVTTGESEGMSHVMATVVAVKDRMVTRTGDSGASVGAVDI